MLFETEIRKFIRKGIMINEVSERLVKLTNLIKPSNLPGNEIFGNDLRKVIPIHSPLQKKIKDELETKGYTVDLIASTATKNQQTMRLGKVIGRELGKDILDKYSTQGGVSVVISRAPLDVLRMSDFENIQSCHSVGGTYFECAIREMNEGGVVAFAVKTNALQNVDLNAPEIFRDDERDVEGINPISRLRLRRYIDIENVEELLIPTTKQYGHTIEGFSEALLDWAKQQQTDKIARYQKAQGKGKKYQFAYMGGDYWDTDDSVDDLLYRILGKKAKFDLESEDGFVTQIAKLPTTFEEHANNLIDKYYKTIDKFVIKRYEIANILTIDGLERIHLDKEVDNDNYTDEIGLRTAFISCVFDFSDIVGLEGLSQKDKVEYKEFLKIQYPLIANLPNGNKYEDIDEGIKKKYFSKIKFDLMQFRFGKNNRSTPEFKFEFTTQLSRKELMKVNDLKSLTTFLKKRNEEYMNGVKYIQQGMKQLFTDVAKICESILAKFKEQKQKLAKKTTKKTAKKTAKK